MQTEPFITPGHTLEESEQRGSVDSANIRDNAISQRDLTPKLESDLGLATPQLPNGFFASETRGQLSVNISGGRVTDLQSRTPGDCTYVSENVAVKFVGNNIFQLTATAPPGKLVIALKVLRPNLLFVEQGGDFGDGNCSVPTGFELNFIRSAE